MLSFEGARPEKDPNKIFVLGVPKVLSEGVKKIFSAIISTRFCKKIFLIKAKNICFVLGVSKVLSEGENKIC